MHNISFPNLGLDFAINPVAFKIGTLEVYWYGIITALAFLVIIIGALKDSDKYGIIQDDLVDLILITSLVGIICARAFYVLVNWNSFRNNLGDVYKIWTGGLAIYGGIIGGIITIYLFCRKRKISALKILDHLVVYFAFGQAIGRWGNFVNQELFGPNTNLPWAMTGDVIRNTITRFPEDFPGMAANLPVHPLFLYESLWNLIAFVVLLSFRKRKKMDGEVFSLYMISYGLARFVIDSMRFDLKVGTVNINRIIGLIFVIAFGVIIIVRRSRKKEGIDEQASEGADSSIYREILQDIESQSSPTKATTLEEHIENENSDEIEPTESSGEAESADSSDKIECSEKSDEVMSACEGEPTEESTPAEE